MSYCVDCGVKLEKAARKCPLCDTVVLNPNVKEEDYENTISAYAKEKNIFDYEDRKHIVILINLILFFLNILTIVVSIVFTPESKAWLVVFGSTIVFSAVISVPLFFNNFNEYLYITIIGVAITLLFFLIAVVVGSGKWIAIIAAPILIAVYIFGLLWILLKKRYNRGLMFSIGITTFFAGSLCVIIESIILIAKTPPAFRLTWSIVVFVCGISISLILLVISKNKRWREEMRRRFHF